MLEKFTPEEIEQIKRELALVGTEYSSTKGTVLKPFREEVKKLLPLSEAGRYYGYHQKNVVHALSILCDYVFENYDVDEKGNIEKISKYVPFNIQKEYMQMMYELLDVAKKYKTNIGGTKQ